MEPKANALLLLATMLPIEIHLEKVQEAITAYNINSNQENADLLRMTLQGAMIWLINDGKIDKAIKMTEEIEKIQKNEKLFNIDKN
jgi:hypothetical protein